MCLYVCVSETQPGEAAALNLATKTDRVCWIESQAKAPKSFLVSLILLKNL